MPTAAVVVKNVGNTSQEWWIGCSTGRGVSGSGCTLGLSTVIWNLPVADMPSTGLLAPNGQMQVGILIPVPTYSDEVCVIKVYKKKDPKLENCGCGAYALVPLPACQIVSFEIY